MSSQVQKHCNNCGSICNVNDVFCRNCGMAISAPKSEETHPSALPSAPLERLQPIPTPPRLDKPPLSVYAPQYSSRPQNNTTYFTVIAILVAILISAAFLVGLFIGRGNPQVITVAPTLTVPTSTLTQSSPTVSIQPGTILYQENGSDNWQGWNTTLGWNIVNGMLTNDGMHTSSVLGPQIVAPFQVPVKDYAVEVIAQVVGSTQRCFGITIRGTSTANGWRGYQGSVNLNGGCEYSNSLGILDDVAPSLGFTPYNVDSAWHTYHLEVKGDIIRFSVDNGSAIHQAPDSRVSSGGQVGLWSVYVQLNVSSFRVIAL